MILQELHLCEIFDDGLSPGCTPLRPPTPPLRNPRLLSLWKRAGPALSGRPGNGAQLHREPPLAIDAVFYDSNVEVIIYDTRQLY